MVASKVFQYKNEGFFSLSTCAVVALAKMQDRTRAYTKPGCSSYVTGKNQRKTLIREKRGIYGWKLKKTFLTR